MAAIFKWAQYTGTSPFPAALYATGSGQVAFMRTEATGTSGYNATAHNMQAGSNSWPIWLKPVFETFTTGTFTNVKVWQFTEGNGSNFALGSASYGVVAATQTVQSSTTSTATSTAQAGVTAIPTAVSSTSSAGGQTPLDLGGVTAAGAGTTYGPKFVVLQMTTNTSAGAGDTGFFGLVCQYDES
jgi:hypothetical protein